MRRERSSDEVGFGRIAGVLPIVKNGFDYEPIYERASDAGGNPVTEIIAMCEVHDETPQSAMSNLASIEIGDLSVSGGTYTLSEGVVTSPPIDWNASAREVTRAVRQLESELRHANLPPRRRRVKHSL